MEEILDLDASEHPPEEPLIGRDEASKQLRRGAEIPRAPGQVAKEDYHHQRRGVQALFCFCDPIRGWRRVNGRDSRTRVDWAEPVRTLLEQDDPDARKVKLVCDNLNTHHAGSLYEAFDAATAHHLARRLELPDTPRNGSWLKVAEIELSILSRQGLNRRIGSAAQLQFEVEAWQAQPNGDESRVIGRFTTADARIKLRHLYPHS